MSSRNSPNESGIILAINLDHGIADRIKRIGFTIYKREGVHAPHGLILARPFTNKYWVRIDQLALKTFLETLERKSSIRANRKLLRLKLKIS